MSDKVCPLLYQPKPKPPVDERCCANCGWLKTKPGNPRAGFYWCDWHSAWLAWDKPPGKHRCGQWEWRCDE